MTVETPQYPIWETESRPIAQQIYAQMRRESPIWRGVGPVTGNDIWFFTRYEDVVAVLKDQRFVKNARNLEPELGRKYIPEDQDPMWDAINQHMLNLDAPDHTRIRGLVHKAFTPARVRDLQPRIAAIADELLTAMEHKSSGDLLEDFAFPLPITVIAEMLGVDRERREDFRRWTRALIFGTDEEAGRIAVMEFMQYVNGLIEVRREADQGDILSALVTVQEDGDSLNHMELLSMVFLLLVAGHETTVNLIGNGTLALMQHPDQKQRLVDDPSLIGNAVEEMLRYNGPVETPTVRFASEDIGIGGVTIPAGHIALPSLLAANRDPAIFENPDTFDITRNPNPHVAFGHGIHFCLGAPLARMEGTIAINALLARFPDIHLTVDADSIEWNPSLLIHGMKALPVTW